MTKIFLWTAGGALAFYAAVVVCAFIFQRSFLYFPPKAPSTPPADAGYPELGFVEYSQKDGGALNGWFRAPAEGRPCIVYFQGNAHHREFRAHKAKDWIDRGYGVLFAGYPGYHGAAGRPTESGLYAAADAALLFLAEEGADKNGLILYGESLGTGVAADLAARRAGQAPQTPQVLGLILETPYTSMNDTGHHHYPWLLAKFLARDSYDTLSKIARAGAPLLVLHGDMDKIVPFKHGKAVYDAAQDPKFNAWFSGGGHTNLYEFGAADHVSRFLERIAP